MHAYSYLDTYTYRHYLSTLVVGENNLNKTDSNIRKRGVDINKKKRTTIKNIRAENFKENIWGNKGGKWNLEKKEKSGTG